MNIDFNPTLRPYSTFAVFKAIYLAPNSSVDLKFPYELKLHKIWRYFLRFPVIIVVLLEAFQEKMARETLFYQIGFNSTVVISVHHLTSVSNQLDFCLSKLPGLDCAFCVVNDPIVFHCFQPEKTRKKIVVYRVFTFTEIS